MNLHDKDFLVSAFMKVKFEQLIYMSEAGILLTNLRKIHLGHKTIPMCRMTFHHTNNK